jgi:hypothetical protein
MSTLTLTKNRLFEGVWEGVLTAGEGIAMKPQLEVFHLDKPVSGVQMNDAPDQKSWIVRVPIPAEIISDGVQTLLVRDKVSDQTLTTITMISGEALADDIRAEVDLLRAELDMLKRAFRRHCLETM